MSLSVVDDGVVCVIRKEEKQKAESAKIKKMLGNVQAMYSYIQQITVS